MVTQGIKGKQLVNNTITQNKLNLITPSIDNDAATKFYVDNNKSTEFLSLNNKNMSALTTISDTQPALACNTAVLEEPLDNSTIIVTINNVEVGVGSGRSCYFSNDGGITPKTTSNVDMGDFLYWSSVNAGYELDSTDKISFNYLITNNSVGSVIIPMNFVSLTNEEEQDIDCGVAHNAICEVDLLGDITLNLINLNGISNGIIDIQSQSIKSIINITAKNTDSQTFTINYQNSTPIETTIEDTEIISISWSFNGSWVNVNYSIYGTII